MDERGKHDHMTREAIREVARLDESGNVRRVVAGYAGDVKSRVLDR
jgi:hypothetical protein